MHQKFFTTEEANRMLPLVRTIVRDIRSKHKIFLESRKKLEELQRDHRIDSGGLDCGGRVAVQVEELERQISDLVDELKGFIAELSDLHLVVKDPASGIVDFPHRRDGQIVYLCWKDGEDRITHWHGVNEGFSGRKPVTASPSPA